MQQAGAPIKIAIIATVLFNLGGVVGGLVLGWLADRHSPHKVLWITYGFGAICVGSIGFLGFSIPLIMSVIMVAGFCGVGGQSVANALAATSYPTSMRATGIGWALGVGRRGHALAGDPDVAIILAVEQPEQIQEGAFAAAGRA